MARLIAERGDILPKLTEVFRTHGFEGASLTVITKATGLGKGSLYHLFPGGKGEMAAAVLDEIDAWFRDHVFVPLSRPDDPQAGIGEMFRAVDLYFRSGDRVCLVGLFALGDVRDRFAEQIQDYFAQWTDALVGALMAAGHDSGSAKDLAEEVVGGIQGALVLARAADRREIFARAITRLEARLLHG